MADKKQCFYVVKIEELWFSDHFAAKIPEDGVSGNSSVFKSERSESTLQSLSQAFL